MILQDDNFYHLLGSQVMPGVVCIIRYQYPKRLAALPLKLHRPEMPFVAESEVHHEDGVHVSARGHKASTAVVCFILQDVARPEQLHDADGIVLLRHYCCTYKQLASYLHLNIALLF